MIGPGKPVPGSPLTPSPCSCVCPSLFPPSSLRRSLSSLLTFDLVAHVFAPFRHPGQGPTVLTTDQRLPHLPSADGYASSDFVAAPAPRQTNSKRTDRSSERFLARASDGVNAANMMLAFSSQHLSVSSGYVRAYVPPGVKMLESLMREETCQHPSHHQISFRAGQTLKSSTQCP